MATDVAAFAKVLREEGIEAAKEEAAKILEEAQKKADKIINSAKSDAEKIEKDANNQIQQNKMRAEDEMRLASRDLLISFRKQIEEVGNSLLEEKTAEVLNSEEIIKTAVMEILKNQDNSGDWEISFSNKIAEPVAASVLAMFKSQGAQAKLGKALNKAGFEVKHGSEVFEVTEESIAESFKKLLSPAFKKLLEA